MGLCNRYCRVGWAGGDGRRGGGNKAFALAQAGVRVGGEGRRYGSPLLRRESTGAGQAPLINRQDGAECEGAYRSLAGRTHT